MYQNHNFGNFTSSDCKYHIDVLQKASQKIEYRLKRGETVGFLTKRCLKSFKNNRIGDKGNEF